MTKDWLIVGCALHRMWDKAVNVAVRWLTVTTHDWREKDRDFETETLGIRMWEHSLAGTKQIMKRGIWGFHDDEHASCGHILYDNV